MLFGAHHAETNYRVSQPERNYPFAQQIERIPSPYFGVPLA